MNIPNEYSLYKKYSTELIFLTTLGNCWFITIYSITVNGIEVLPSCTECLSPEKQNMSPYPLNKRLCGTQNWSCPFGEEKTSCPAGNRTRMLLVFGTWYS
jgi:hypothetical protein